MDIFLMVWGWISSHWSEVVTGVTQTKLFTDTAKNIKELAPPKLEGKEAATNFVNQTLETLNDEKKTIEEKQWEVTARKELVESLVKVTAVEASYNIARYAIFTTFTAFIFRALVYFFSEREARRIFGREYKSQQRKPAEEVKGGEL